jgi:single-strand DNA-binding protein
MVNKVILVGRVGKDPEVTYLPNSDATAKFSLATSRKYTKDGTKHEKTEWHNITAWRKLAEIVERYVKKGMLLYVEGEIESREWEKDGEKRRYYGIVINAMQILSGNNDFSHEDDEP